MNDEIDEHGNRIWRSRYADARPEAHKKYVDLLLQTLSDLEAATRPSFGNETEKKKDLNAFDAMRFSGDLVRAVAGWSLDHQVGLAAEGLKFVPLQPSGTKEHEQYISGRELVDRHAHERAGGSASLDTTDPFFLRKSLINFLRGNPGGMPEWLCHAVINGCEALEYGEVQPIFQPVKTGNKRDLTQKRLMLQAVVHAEYRRARGATKKIAQEVVSELLNISRETLDSWEARLRSEFGDLEVARNISFARNHASWVNGIERRRRAGEVVSAGDEHMHSSDYDDDALAKLATAYKTAISK